MRELDLALFPSPEPSSGPPWPVDGTLSVGRELQIFASGMPPPAEIGAPLVENPAPDLSWLRQIEMPDIPVRWDARVVRYLEFYKNAPRGRSMISTWLKKSGRYGGAIRRVLRDQGLPEDILWLSLVESGFDPTVRSPAGAAGLWQFMPEGARIYGLTVDRWVDERLDPERSSLAAARYLADLHQRFGAWELAFAAYNMGYGGLLAAIRKYNTNDFWELSRLEAGVPLETALYVPKIIAMAIVARNRSLFGLDDVELDPAVVSDKIAVGSGVSLKTVATAAKVDLSAVEAVNPQLLAGRTPPLAPWARNDSSWTVRVPAGSGPRAAQNIPRFFDREEKLERYLVRWGESLDDIASFRTTTRSALQRLNGLRPGEIIRPGTVLFVPAAAGVGRAAAQNLLAKAPEVRPVIVVPEQQFAYPDRRRVFYRVIAGDALREIASVFAVSADELCRWNGIDPGASLHDGMTLQVFAPAGRDLSSALFLDEKDARVVAVGSPEFFTHFEALKGRKRVEIVAREGDSWNALSKRYALSLGMLERINHRGRSTPLHPGDRVVVYAPASLVADPKREDKPSDTAVAGAPREPPAEEASPEEAATRPASFEKAPEETPATAESTPAPDPPLVPGRKPAPTEKPASGGAAARPAAPAPKESPPLKGG
jgi:membrane-bound lytic murein transglycosylase D